jgi:hypothetical protein
MVMHLAKANMAQKMADVVNAAVALQQHIAAAAEQPAPAVGP